MNSIQSQLKRIRYKFRNKIIEVKAVKNFKHSIEIFGKIIGPFIAGNHYKMEYWIAKEFIKYNILQFTESEHINAQRIQKIAFNQSHTEELLKLDPNLFTAITEYMGILSDGNERDDKNYRKFISFTQELIRLRQSKILALSQINTTLSLTQNLSEEEKILLSHSSSTVHAWKDYFLNIPHKKSK
ncbi:MAG: hypothetical protein JW776_03935 [Candidatus Lokiarchaeota archaeon]|nr:hypothetical protein [Candidatus Lokiarchaeota archaeon]